MKLALRTQTFLKSSHASTLSIGTEEIKAKSEEELCKQQETVTLSDCNHLAHVIVLWQIQNVICYCTVFALFYYFVFGQFFSSTRPRGLIFGEAI